MLPSYRGYTTRIMDSKQYEQKRRGHAEGLTNTPTTDKRTLQKKSKRDKNTYQTPLRGK